MWADSVAKPRCHAPSSRKPVRRAGRRRIWRPSREGSRSLGDKQAAKQRRRENRDERERAKFDRTGASPAQEAEAVRRDNEPDPNDKARREGLDGSVGGDTAG